MSSNIKEIRIGKLTIFIKHTWDYQECLLFQKDLVEQVKNDTSKRFMILCSHPHLFTNGRGLQKGKNISSLELQSFDNSTKLPFPLHKISRGGGLTFHYPGQFIVYPILKLNANTFSLKKVINGMMDLVIKTSEKLYQFDDLDYDRDLLGLWWKEKKLASIGIATERYVTYHGMAVNLELDEKMKSALKSLFPCGIDPVTYTDLSTLVDKAPLIREKFEQEFLSQLECSFWTK